MAKICQLHADLKYFLCMQPVDMRKQFQGLQGIVNEEFGRYLTQDEAFVFIGKTMKTAKILHRESNGLTMYVRRLSEGSDYSGINVPLVAVCNVPPVAQCNVPPQKWLQ